MSTEASIDALTAQTSGLLEVCTNLKSNTARLIAEAVVISENAAIVPLITVAQNLIDTQTMLVTYIARG